jgi:hypothetical protein
VSDAPEAQAALRKVPPSIVSGMRARLVVRFAA